MEIDPITDQTRTIINDEIIDEVINRSFESAISNEKENLSVWERMRKTCLGRTATTFLGASLLMGALAGPASAESENAYPEQTQLMEEPLDAEAYLAVQEQYCNEGEHRVLFPPHVLSPFDSEFRYVDGEGVIPEGDWIFYYVEWDPNHPETPRQDNEFISVFVSPDKSRPSWSVTAMERLMDGFTNDRTVFIFTDEYVRSSTRNISDFAIAHGNIRVDIPSDVSLPCFYVVSPDSKQPPVDTGTGGPDMEGTQTGLVDISTATWNLRESDGTTTNFIFGNPGDYPFVGDWNGDGVDTPGMYRQSDGNVYLRNSNTQGIADIKYFFGDPGDIPLAGDFNGDGSDTVSIYRPNEQKIYIINSLGSDDGGLGVAENSYYFGNPGDKPYVGDFDGDGIDEVALHRESTGFTYYRNTQTTGVADVQLYYGDPGDQMIAGDWFGAGEGVKEGPGVYRQSTKGFYLKLNPEIQGNADLVFSYDPYNIGKQIVAIAGIWRLN